MTDAKYPQIARDAPTAQHLAVTVTEDVFSVTEQSSLIVAEVGRSMEKDAEVGTENDV